MTGSRFVIKTGLRRSHICRVTAIFPGKNKQDLYVSIISRCSEPDCWNRSEGKRWTGVSSTEVLHFPREESREPDKKNIRRLRKLFYEGCCRRRDFGIISSASRDCYRKSDFAPGCRLHGRYQQPRSLIQRISIRRWTCTSKV